MKLLVCVLAIAASLFGQSKFDASTSTQFTNLFNAYKNHQPPQPPPAPAPIPPPPSSSTPTGPICLTVPCWQGGTISTGSITMVNQGSSLAVTVPEVNFIPGDANQPHLNYLRTNFTKNLSGGTCNVSGVIVPSYCLTGTFQVVTTGSPTFNYDIESGDDCTNSNCMPASLHFLLEHSGDQCLCTDGYRWWYDVYIPLAQGVYTFTIPFNYEDWTGVYGEIDQATFTSTLQNMGQIGFTCGGGYFDGHGCSVSNGTAQIVFTSLAITQ